MQFAERINFEYCEHKNFARKKYIAKGGRNESMERRINAESFRPRDIGRELLFLLLHSRVDERYIFYGSCISRCIIYICINIYTVNRCTYRSARQG